MSKIFLSHSSKDKKIVRKLANSLTKYGYSTWLDEWEIIVGDSIIQKIQKGIEESDYVILILSKNSVCSKWVENEWQAKFWTEIEDKKIMVLPVLIEDCNIPSLLKPKKYADFRYDFQKGLFELLTALRNPPCIAGIAKYYQDFIDISDDWVYLFNHTKNIDILAMYSQTWRNTYLKYIKNILFNKGTVRVVLPDFLNNRSLANIAAKRLSISTVQIQKRILLAIEEFSELDNEHGFEIYLTDRYFNHAFYLFDVGAIFALYSYEDGRVQTPAMLLEDGQFINFLRKDFNYLIQNKNLTKLVYPK